MKWNSELYNSSQNFVAEYGKNLLEFVPERAGRILDLGCGTGTLSAELSRRCNYVLGMDSSESMIQTARDNYPDLDFETGNALELSDQEKWDVVFSNAVFHWIHDHDLLLAKIYQALKPGGKLVCEFGGSGNIASIEEGFDRALGKIGGSYRSKFNFPTVSDFENLLLKDGFVIEQIVSYDRPTPLKDGEAGLTNWALQFFQSELEPLSETERKAVLDDLNANLKDSLWNGSCWIADYKRLRVIATKSMDSQ